VSDVTIRAMTADDLSHAGRIIYRAFSRSFRRYGYTEPVADARGGAALAAAAFASDPGGGLLLTTDGGRPIGVGFYQRCADDAFIGPVAIDPDAQGRGHGRRLLREILTFTADRSCRLLQDSFNPVSFRLYARAGFAVRDVLSLLVTGPGGPYPVPFEARPLEAPGGVWSLRDVTPRDMPLVARLDREACGVDRAELLERLAPRIRGVILDGPKKPRGFACAFRGSGVWVVGPGWAEDGRTLAAIVVGLAQRCVREREAVAVFAPASDTALVPPLLDVGFRVSHLVNLMVRGEFTPWTGSCLPVLPVDTSLVD